MTKKNPKPLVTPAVLAIILMITSAPSASAQDGWDFDLAMDAFRRALSLSPSLPIAHLAIGDICILRGQSDAALRHLDAALELDPLDLGLGMNKGDFLIMAGRYGEAVRQLRRTLELDPDHWVARWAMGWALLSENRNEYIELLMAASKLGVLVGCQNWRLASFQPSSCATPMSSSIRASISASVMSGNSRPASSAARSM
mgnify:CR=1 FL=1